MTKVFQNPKSCPNRKSAFLFVFVCLLTCTAIAEQRFPPPEFETAHQLPITLTPAARAVLLQYLDVLVLAGSLAVATWLVFKKRSRKGIFFLGSFSLAYFGFYRQGCVCSIGSVQNVALALADSSYAAPLTVLAFFLLPLVFALFSGRVFCSGVCPHGALQDLVLVRPLKVPYWLEQGLSVLPFIYLGAGVLFAATGSAFIFCEYDPFVALFRLSGRTLMVGAGIGLLLLAMFIGRPYCRFLCPYGALLKITSAVAKLRVRITPTICTQCRLCEHACPFGAIREPESSRAEPDTLARDRRKLGWLLLLLPLLILAGAAFGGRFASSASLLHPTIQLALEQSKQTLDSKLAVAESAAVHAQHTSGEVLARATQIQHRFNYATIVFGIWAALVVGLKLVTLALRRNRPDYEPDSGSCLACARCFESCPEQATLTDRQSYSSFAAPKLLSVLRWRSASWFSAVFCLLTALTLLFNFAIALREDPLRSPALTRLKQQLQFSPGDESIKLQIRELDLHLRQMYFRQLKTTHLAAWLLLAGVAAFLVSVAKGSPRSELLPELRRDETISTRAIAGRAQWSVIIFSGGIAIALLALSAWHGGALPKSGILPKATATATATDFASSEELQANWPRFLGPNGNGSCSTPGPTAWNTGTGEGITWKIAAPAAGFSSPIIWNERLFISGGDANVRSVFCIEANTGRLLWQKHITKSVASSSVPATDPATGYAASTMATDGRRVFAIFSTGDLAALDFNGELLWSKCLGPLKNTYGHASSLLTFQGRLLVQVDQGESDQGRSRIYAFDGASGETVWQIARRVGCSWSTPALVETAGKTQVVALAVPSVSSYSIDAGVELWRVEGIDGEVTPSPIAAAGLVFAVSPAQKLLAIRPDGQSDVTKTHVIWSSEDNVPDITTPASNGELLFTVSTGATLTCYDAKTGAKQWTHEIDSEFHASPAIAGNALYLFSKKGQALVIETARQYKELLRTDMPDTFSASPAFARGNVYLRGETNLWCIGPLRGQMAK